MSEARDSSGDSNLRAPSRRNFLQSSLPAAGGLAAFVAALSPLTEIDPDDLPSAANFFRKHYKELGPEEIQALLVRVAKRIRERWGIEAEVRDVRAKDGTEFVYALNLSRCIGCRKCVYACESENNTSRSPQLQYIRVLEMPLGTLDVEQGDHHYDPETVPREGQFYMPIQCQQCADPPCTKVCPVEATWTDEDGITVVDFDWCIGCRYCQAACPYWARRFNFAEPDLTADELNPDLGYLSNRPRPVGVVEKCTYCSHRTREGQLPACLEACPVGARKFGNVLDPESEISRILKSKRIFVLKEEANTLPRFFYYFDERYPRGEEPAMPEAPPDEEER